MNACDGCVYKGGEDCPLTFGIDAGGFCPNGKLPAADEPEAAEVEIEGGGSTWWFVCGECRGQVDRNDKYCQHCGRRLKD